MIHELNKTYSYPGWEEFYSKKISEKLPFFIHDNRYFDILFAQQYDREFLDELCQLAETVRKVAREKIGADFLANLLSHKRSMLYFVQPSTRTFLSFLNACHILGIKTSEIRDTSTSSQLKGESAEDTIRTFASYVDLIIVRHREKGFAEKTAWVLNNSDRPIPVVNGGSGPDQHPTQALLDVYTMFQAFADQGGLDNKTVALVGDLKRGRTVRSLTYLMRNYRNVHLIFVSPPSLRMEDDIIDFLKRNDMSYEELDRIGGALPHADAIYMTRVQDEYDNARLNSDEEIYSHYYLLPQHLDILKPNACIMHPLPRRHEIHVSIDTDKRAWYWRQERNGMWIRVAIMAYLFKIDDQIYEFAKQ